MAGPTPNHHSLDLHAQVGDQYDEAHVLTHLGDTHLAGGDPHRVRTAWYRALAILSELDHPEAEPVRAKLFRLDRSDLPVEWAAE